MAVTRRKGKTVILFIIFAAIANLVLAGLAIQHATKAASVLARQKLGGQLTLRYNLENALQEARAQGGEQRPRIQAEPVTEEMVKTVAGQKHIVGYNALVNANGLAQGFTAVTTSESQQETASGDQPRGRGGLPGGDAFVLPDVTVTGVSSSALLDSFANGEAKLVAGRVLTPADAGKKVALIEENLAAQNGLKVGSTLTIKATRADATVQYTVAGIYRASGSSTSNAPGMRDLPFTEPYNRVFVDYQSAIPLKTAVTAAGTQSGGIDQAIFYVDDPKNIDQVKSDVKAMKLDWTKFTLDANDAAYQQMTGPIENVAAFSQTIVYLVAVAGAIILSLVLTLSIRERRYETGVLLSLGESKLRVVAQYVTEVVLIALVAFGLSLFSGRAIAQGVGQSLLNREVKVVREQGAGESSAFGRGFGQLGGGFGPRAGGWFGRQTTADYQAIDSLNVRITPAETGQLAAVGLAILLGGTILPAAAVMRYKPRTILSSAS